MHAGLVNVQMQDSGGVHLVSSDIIAGISLVQRQQQMRAMHSRDVVDSSSAPLRQLSATDTGPSSQSMPSWMTLENASHFMKFANASYGWYSNALSGRLCCYCR